MRAVRYVLKHLGICLATALLFFQTKAALLILIPLTLIRMYRERHVLKNRRRKLLEEHFRDGLQCLLASLEAGYSIENSIRHAAEDLRMMFEEKEPIVEEFRRMSRKLNSGGNVEDVIEEFGERSGVEDIRTFSGIFTIAKRTGGDVTKVIRSVTDTLYQKQEVMREIQTVLLAKQLEVGIMKVMPYLMLGYFLVFSPGFLAPLYAGIAGHAVMLAMYLLYRMFCMIAERIACIEV
ncbi:MAG: type II secretion system F family protein [Lachnospiraceae bacterium]|nr:type II secretion system F family protein [Lachnospiraceae bacterium]